MADDLRAALDEMNRKYGPERTWAGGIPCVHDRRTDGCEWCSPETDIRYALAADLERMGLWPDEDREQALEDYEHRPNDWHIDTP